MNKDTLNILIIEDDQLSRLSLRHRLLELGNVWEAGSKSEALELLKKQSFHMAFIDLDLEAELAGLDVLTHLVGAQTYPIVLSGREDEQIIEQAYQLGCRDYLAKPFNSSSINLVFKKFFASQNSEQTFLKLKKVFLTEDETLLKELKTIEEALLSDRPILITGESGTGKSFLAKFIHELSGKGALVHLNCAEISESLLESELFGHEKGAFTGAHKNKKGLLELAHGGTLFLDEIATMPLAVQKKLLKAIEEGSFYPLGSEQMVRSQFRLITATCEDLKEKIQKNEFRADFYFRIVGFNVQLRPLRQRKADLNRLVQHFIKKGQRLIVFDSAAKAILQNYSWPGNVRELERTIEILQTKDRGIVSAADLLPLLTDKLQMAEASFNYDEIKELGLKAYLEKLEVRILKMALEKNVDKVRKTLSDLKISNNSYYRILENSKNRGAKNV